MPHVFDSPVAKLRNDVLIEVPDARRRRRLTVTNCREEHDRLVAELHALGRPVLVGLEPTGHYHRPLAWRLVQAGFDVRLISSVALGPVPITGPSSWDRCQVEEPLSVGTVRAHPRPCR